MTIKALKRGRQRDATLESPTLRLTLTPRRKPYPGPRLAPGLKLAYRRNKASAGAWIARLADGSGGYREVRIADADDFEARNHTTILGFFEAQTPAKQLLGGGAHAALTLDVALNSYAVDLKARRARDSNAALVRYHLKGHPLQHRPLAVISAAELKAWRNGMAAKGLAPSSVNRVRAALRACLELAMPSRSHIWKEGLESLPNATRARKLLFPDATILALVAAAYARDPALGLLCDVLASTGMRPIQAAAMRCEDVIADAKPRLMVSKTAKGGGRNRSEKRLQRYPFPITPALCAKLKQAAKGRPDHAPLLLKSDGEPWDQSNPHGDYRYSFAAVAEACGLAADTGIYAFRHSNIARMLMKKGVHTKIVADLHDTSEQMIRQHYGKFITDFSDDIAREALLHTDASTADNVLALKR
jgi:integrase